MDHYTVFPVDRTNTVETSKTETALKDLCGETHVVPIFHDDEQNRQLIDSWSVTLESDNLVATIENIDRIRTVERNDQIDDRLSSPRSKPRSSDDEEYIVLAKAGTNMLETEVLLKTNIKEGTTLYLIQFGDKVLGWGGVVLDAKAKEVVEACDAIIGIVNNIKFNADDAVIIYDRPPTPEFQRQYFSCIAKEGSDVQKTEEFLKTKVRKGSKFHQFKRNGQVTGWWKLALSEDAKRAVEDCDDLEYFETGGQKLADLQALASDNRPGRNAKRVHPDTRSGQTFRCLAKVGSDIQKTEAFLKSKVEKNNPYYHFMDAGEVIGWWGLVLDDDAKDAVEAYEDITSFRVGVKMVDYDALTTHDRPPELKSAEDTHQDDIDKITTDTIATATIPTLQARDLKLHHATTKDSSDPESPRKAEEQEVEWFDGRPTQELPSKELGHVQPVRRDTPTYRCLAKNASDTDAVKRTEEFLRSKVQPGSKFYYYKNNGQVRGWWRLALDDDAKKAVQDYEGIKYFKLGGIQLQDFLALPAQDVSSSKSELQEPTNPRHISREGTTQTLPFGYHSRFEEGSVVKRGEEWKKQERAAKSLVMNSQYK
jgi:hypothetical protein